MHAPARVAAGVLVAFALLLTAVLLWSSGEMGFGWFAYGPLPDQLTSNVVVMTGRRKLALVVGTAGLLLLALLAGFTLGRRSGRGRPQ